MARGLTLAALLVVVGGTFAYAPVKWTNLYVKWNVLSFFAVRSGNGFFKMPLSLEEARAANWTQAASNATTSTWCYKDDPRVCILYDNQGSVAGMQVSLPVQDIMFENSPYDIDDHPFFFRDKLLDTDVISVRYFLVSQETLSGGGRARAAGEEIGEGLWLQRGSDLVEVPRNAELLPPYWSTEKCIINMGRHYYYNVSRAMDCRDFEPFFLVVDNQRSALQAVGFQTMGKASASKHRTWFETVPAAAVRPTFNDPPQCLEEWGAKYGIISLHMYFVEEPWFIVC